MRPARRSRASAHALGVATLVVMSGVGMGVSGEPGSTGAACGSGPCDAVADDTHDDGHGHDHPTTTTTRPTTTTTLRPVRPRPRVRPRRPRVRPPPRRPGHRSPASSARSSTTGRTPSRARRRNPDGKHGHAHTGNMFQLFAEKPCTNCYITGMRASLKNTGWVLRPAGAPTLSCTTWCCSTRSWGRQDATCSGQFLGFLGERFFASGDERTAMPTMGATATTSVPGQLDDDLRVGEPQHDATEHDHRDDLRLGPGDDAGHADSSTRSGSTSTSAGSPSTAPGRGRAPGPTTGPSTGPAG